MRLFAIPILRHRWAYYCYSDLKITSHFTKAVAWSARKWETFGTAEPRSWKKKLHDRGNAIMNQHDYQEWFLKGVPMREHLETPPKKVILEHPTSLSSDAVQQHLEELLRERIPYHKKYLYYSAYWVPIASLFVIVPLIPNIPLAYNLFRLYSHYKAYKGAQHLASLAQSNSICYTPTEKLDQLLSSAPLASSHDIVFPSAVQQAVEKAGGKPKLSMLQDDMQGVLDSASIKRLTTELGMPALDVELGRARSQILLKILRQQHSNKPLKKQQ